MQSHKRPHELSDIFLKNLISALFIRAASYLISDSASVPISEAAILQRAVLLSSDHFSS